MGFNPSAADKCLFLNQTLPERFAVLVWVDDFLVMHQLQSTFDDFLAQLRRKFNINVVGPLTCFLGMEVLYDRANGCLRLCQANTTSVLLERAKLTD